MSSIPLALYGLIGGSNTWGAKFPEDFGWPDVRVVRHIGELPTPYGLSAPFKLLEVCGQPVLRVAMHGCFPNENDQIYPWVAARQVAWVFRQAGVQYAITDGSVGGIQTLSGAALPPWSAVVPADFLQYYFPDHPDAEGGRIPRRGLGDFFRVAEPFCPVLRSLLVESASAQPEFSSVIDGGVYALTQWGRVETAAEIRVLKQFGCHIVGQTVAFEAAAMRFFGIHFASLNVVSNYAEGDPNGWIGDDPGAMAQFYRDCPKPTGNAVMAALKRLIEKGAGACHCDDFAITNMAQFPVMGA